MKKCPTCNIIKELSDFPLKGDGKYKAHCKLCYNEYRRNRHKTNCIVREKEIKRGKINNKKRKKAKRQYIKIIKEKNCCVDCGKFFPYYVMHFDHMENKYKNISSIISSNRSMKVLLAEINKCELVCSNCHRNRTYIRMLNEQEIKKIIRPSVLFVRNYKYNKPCNDCYIVYPYWMLDFDHIMNNKRSEVSTLAWKNGVEDVKLEIEKCVLICSNCHSIRTHNRQSMVKSIK